MIEKKEKKRWQCQAIPEQCVRGWEKEREVRGGGEICHCTRMSFQCECDAPPAKTQWYLRDPSHSTVCVTVYLHLHKYSIYV